MANPQFGKPLFESQQGHWAFETGLQEKVGYHAAIN